MSEQETQDLVAAFTDVYVEHINVMNEYLPRIRNVEYNSNTNTTSIYGRTNFEELKVNGNNVAMNGHTHSLADITDYTPANLDNQILASKADVNHTHTLSDITDFSSVDLSQYFTEQVLNSALSTKANTQHEHSAADVYLHEVDGLVEQNTPLNEVLANHKNIMTTNANNIDTMASSVNTLAESIQDYIEAGGGCGGNNSVNGDTITFTANLGAGYAKKTDLNGKADVNHTHTLADITDYTAAGLDTAIFNSKADVNHTHTLSDITDFNGENIDLSNCAKLNEANTFTGNQTINGTITATNLRQDNETRLAALENHNHDSSYAPIIHYQPSSSIIFPYEVSITDSQTNEETTRTLNKLMSNIFEYEDDNMKCLYNFSAPSITLNGNDLATTLSNLNSFSSNVSILNSNLATQATIYLNLGAQETLNCCAQIGYYNAASSLADCYLYLGIINSNPLEIYKNLIRTVLPITTTSTITSSNLSADNETRLAACETALNSHNHDGTYAKLGYDNTFTGANKFTYALTVPYLYIKDYTQWHQTSIRMQALDDNNVSSMMMTYFENGTKAKLEFDLATSHGLGEYVFHISTKDPDASNYSYTHSLTLLNNIGNSIFPGTISTPAITLNGTDLTTSFTTAALKVINSNADSDNHDYATFTLGKSISTNYGAFQLQYQENTHAIDGIFLKGGFINDNHFTIYPNSFSYDKTLTYGIYLANNNVRTGGTITATNVLANNETRLAACESAITSLQNNSSSVDLSGYAKLSSNNTFTGENTFKNHINQVKSNMSNSSWLYYYIGQNFDSYGCGFLRFYYYSAYSSGDNYFDIGLNGGAQITFKGGRVIVYNYLSVNGPVECTSVFQGSDRRLKENINEIPEEQSVNVIDNLKVYSFYFKERKDIKKIDDENKEEDVAPYPKKIHYGVIAQELQQLAPELVGADDLSDEHYLSVNYIELIPHLINKIHAQDKRINELEEKLNRLLETNSTMPSTPVLTS